MYASGVCSPHRTVSTMLGSASSSSLSSFVSPVCAAARTRGPSICVFFNTNKSFKSCYRNSVLFGQALFVCKDKDGQVGA